MTILPGNQQNKNSDPAGWDNKKIDQWFDKYEWTSGWKIKCDPSVNKKALAISWYKNSDRWSKAFEFLKNNDLTRLEPRRYDIDGDNLYASISDYQTKDRENSNFEVHRKYIDIQYVITGNEIMDLTPLTNREKTITAYDDQKDIEFMTVKDYKGHVATPQNFLIFFPSDAHRPQIKDGVSKPVRKIVIKLRVD
jgi:biofilm protein TabA